MTKSTDQRAPGNTCSCTACYLGRACTLAPAIASLMRQPQIPESYSVYLHKIRNNL